jgi:hypothetical protein
VNTDTIRMHYTYVLAALIVIGGGALIFAQLDEIPPEALIAFVSGAFGFALGFVFNRESTIGGARAQERAVAQGVAAASPTPTQEPPADPNDRRAQPVRKD